MIKLAGKQDYGFNKYCDFDRWSSYWHQIDEILKVSPKNVLEVGIGDRVVARYLKNNTFVKYTGLDIDDNLSPDIKASVENIPLPDNSFDAVCAFEILEHLPFEKFTSCLSELKRVSRKYIIISLPHWGRHFSLQLRMPFLKKLAWQYKFNFFPINHKPGGQHYWEIGKKNYSLKKIKRRIEQAELKIVNDYVVFNSPYHHFFVLTK